jgi:hypothetical protein
MRTPGRIILAAAALTAATACASSTLRTSVDYDRSINFSKYRTFAYRDVQQLRSELVGRRIHQALTDALTARGLQENQISPDLWVVPHVRLSHETEIRTYNTGWGYGWRWRRPGPAVATVEQIPVGTLIVDLVDATAKEMVWRGTATDTLKPRATPAEKEAALTRAIAKMLEGFPPGS